MKNVDDYHLFNQELHITKYIYIYWAALNWHILLSQNNFGKNKLLKVLFHASTIIKRGFLKFIVLYPKSHLVKPMKHYWASMSL